MPDHPHAAKRSARHAWSTGRYPALAPNLLPVIARLIRTTVVDPGDRVLDLGCGTGNVALGATRVGGDVVGVDLAREMLDLASDNAGIARLERIHWLEGDAEGLPFRNGGFDVVLSNFGFVFAPDHAAVAAELARVVRPDGRLGFTAWSADGLVGRLTDVVVEYGGTDPAMARAHLQWAEPATLEERLLAFDYAVTRRVVGFRYPTPAHFWREFAEESGALAPTLARIDDETVRDDLRAAAIDVIDEWFSDNTLNVDYLEVVGTRQS